MFETETKVQVDDLIRTEAQVRRLGAKLVKTQRHVDVYLGSSHRDLQQTDKVLRIRRASPGKCMVTYKGPRITKRVKTRGGN